MPSDCPWCKNKKCLVELLVELLLAFRFYNSFNKGEWRFLLFGKSDKSNGAIELTGPSNNRNVPSSILVIFAFGDRLSNTHTSSTLMFRISLMQKMPAYSTSKMKRNRISTRDAFGVSSYLVISVTTSFERGSLEWIGLASFRLAPSITDFTKGWCEFRGLVPALWWPHLMLYAAASMTAKEWPLL